MARYLIESKHTPKECLTALDEIMSKGTDVLDKFEWGCMAGEHVGWAYVDADNETSVKRLIPGYLQNKTHIVKLNKFTPDQIRSFHEKK